MTWAVWRPAPGAACALLVGTGRHVRPSSLSRIPQAVTAVRALGAALSGEKGVFDVRRTTVVAEPADTRQVLALALAVAASKADPGEQPYGIFRM